MEDINIQPKKVLLTSKEIVSRARKFYKDNFKKLWPLYILGGLGGMSFNFRSNAGSYSNVAPLFNIPSWVWLLIGLAITAIYIFFFISKISLLKGISETHKGQFVGVRDSYKKGLAIFWSYILVVIMFSWSVTGAMVLLIVPGIILSGYLVFTINELVDKQKKGFQALLGSWALVKGNWWTLFGKSIMIGLRIFVRVLLYFLAILVVASVLIVPGAVLHIQALLITGIVLGSVAALLLLFGFYMPLLLIAMFEMYYSFCEVKESSVPDVVLDKKRKHKLVASMVIGIIAMMLIMVIVFVVIALVGVTQYIDKSKNLGQVHHLEFYEERTPAETQQILAEQTALENPYFKPTELTGKYLTKASVIFDETTYKPEIILQFDNEGAQIFANITARNTGKPLAIFLDGASIIDTNGDGKIDNQDLYAPIVQGEIVGGKAVITGDMSFSTADKIAEELNSGVE